VRLSFNEELSKAVTLVELAEKIAPAGSPEYDQYVKAALYNAWPMFRHAATEIARLTEMAKLQGQEIGITRERDEALEKALHEIIEADSHADLPPGQCGSIAIKALGLVGGPGQ
jgi:hypothetical protein